MAPIQLGDQLCVVLRRPSAASGACADADRYEQVRAIAVHQQFASELAVVGSEADFQEAVFCLSTQRFDNFQIAIDLMPHGARWHDQVEGGIESAIEALLDR